MAETVIGHIRKAREKGTSDDMILKGILELNPDKQSLADSELAEGLSSTDILEEIILANREGYKQGIPRDPFADARNFIIKDVLRGTIDDDFSKNFLQSMGEEIFRNILGSRGVLGVFQKPGRIVETLINAKTAKDIIASRDALLKSVEKMNVQYAKLNGEEKENLGNLIRGSNQAIEDINAQLGQLEKRRLTPGEAIQTGINALITVATFGAGTLAKSANPALSFIGRTLQTKAVTGQGLGTFVKTTATRAATTGTITGAFSAGKAIAEELPASEVAKRGLTGFGVGAGLSLTGSILKGIIEQVVPRVVGVLSSTSQAVEQNLKEPAGVKVAKQRIKEGGLSAAVEDSQKEVYKLRTELTNHYQTESDKLAQQYKGKRIGLNKDEIEVFDSLKSSFKKFRVNLPENLDPRNLSVKEALELNKAINQILPNLKGKVEGVDPSWLHDQLKDKMVTAFGGEKAGVDKLLTEYGTQKQLLDNTADFLGAYSKGDAASQDAALRNLMNLFKDKKPFMTEALNKLSPNIANNVAALQFTPMAPRSFWAKMTSGIIGGGGVITSLATGSPIPALVGGAELLAESPRVSSFIAQKLGEAGQSTISGPISQIFRLIGTQAGSKIADRVRQQYLNNQSTQEYLPESY